MAKSEFQWSLYLCDNGLTRYFFSSMRLSSLCTLSNGICQTGTNLYQIENEYGDVESSYGQGGKEYVQWAAQMALGLGAGVPWVMCKQSDAPENIVILFVDPLCA